MSQTCGLIQLSGLRDRPTKNIIWKSSDIPKQVLIPVGDRLFDFALVGKNIQTPSNPISSYADYGFGSDKRTFAGSHRFAINRNERTEDERGAENLEQVEPEEEYVEVYVESFT